MAIVTDQPEDLPTTNALKSVGPSDALQLTEIYMSNTSMISLANPPGRGEDIVVMARLRVTGKGVKFPEDEDAPEKPHVKTRLVNCWLPSDPEPEMAKTKEERDAEAAAEAAQNQPPLYALPGEEDPDADGGPDGPEFSG